MRLATAVLVALCACAQDDAEGVAVADARLARPGPAAQGAIAQGAIDSALPLGEALRRFRVGLDAPRSLHGGAPSRELLVRRLVRAIERRDTTAIRSMLVDRAEFAFFYYPSSPFVREPSRQAAGLVWFLAMQESQTGITRAFDRFGGSSAVYRGHHCLAPPRRESDNLLWDACTVHLGRGAERVAIRLFGSILRRGSQYKFLSYANDL